MTDRSGSRLGADADIPQAVRMSCAEAARYLGVSLRQLERWRADRRGPPFFRPPTMRPFYLRSDLDDWLAAARIRTFSA